MPKFDVTTAKPGILLLNVFPKDEQTARKKSFQSGGNGAKKVSSNKSFTIFQRKEHEQLTKYLRQIERDNRENDMIPYATRSIGKYWSGVSSVRLTAKLHKNNFISYFKKRIVSYFSIISLYCIHFIFCFKNPALLVV